MNYYADNGNGKNDLGTFEEFVNEKNFVCCVGGDYNGKGFSGMFKLEAEGESNIQIPIWFYYGTTTPWEVMAAFANIKSFYNMNGNDMYYHMKDEAADANKVHIWRSGGGDTEGGAKVIKNNLLKISFSDPDRITNLTIEDA